MGEWDELHKVMSAEKPHEKVISFHKEHLKKGMRVLDLGCGKGRNSIYLAKQGIETHAVDSSDVALQVVNKVAEESQLFELLKVTKADIRELLFPDGYFDAVITVNVVNHGHWKDVKAYFAEAERILKPNGLLLVIGLSTAFLADAKGPETKEIEPGTYLNLSVPDGKVPHHLFSKEDIDELLDGFKIIKSSDFREHSEWLKRDVTHLEIVARKKAI